LTSFDLELDEESRLFDEDILLFRNAEKVVHFGLQKL